MVKGRNTEGGREGRRELERDYKESELAEMMATALTLPIEKKNTDLLVLHHIFNQVSSSDFSGEKQ